MLEIITKVSTEHLRSLPALRCSLIAALHPEDPKTRNAEILQAAVSNQPRIKPDLSDEEHALFSEIYWDLVIERVITPIFDERNLPFEGFQIRSDVQASKE